MSDNNDTKNPFKDTDSEMIVDSNKNQDENTDNNKNEQQEETVEQDKTEESTQDDKENKIDEIKKQYNDLNNKYIRLAADFDNFRKRTQAEKEELSQYTIANVLAKLTSVLDTFDRAQEHLKDVEECKTVKEGYEVAYKQLTEALKKIGLEEIDALGKPFNPNEHEAVTKIPTDEFEPDCIAAVMQKGYKLDKRIVRPAMVAVAAKKED